MVDTLPSRRRLVNSIRLTLSHHRRQLVTNALKHPRKLKRRSCGCEIGDRLDGVARVGLGWWRRDDGTLWQWCFGWLGGYGGGHGREVTLKQVEASRRRLRGCQRPLCFALGA
jgi:hypothetical protein